jgi:uncharacterized protein (DUF362 family)
MAIDRRSFLRLGAASSIGLLALPRLAAASGWVVGVGRDPNAYTATLRAIDACGEWPLLGMAGRTVVIKPNLVAPLPASTGTTTDPEAVRAVVDRALADGAAEALIVETAATGAHFGPCGYGFFDSYDPLGRVRLVDLGTLPLALAPVPGGLAYSAMWIPALLLRDDIVFVSIGKLKVHIETLVTLSTKNLFGLPGVASYPSSSRVSEGRMAMHDRGASQAIVDINKLRPVHFALVEGIWGMDGVGPALGTPVRMDLVLAGRNAVAVDCAALASMALPPFAARHLVYASREGLGPSSVGDVTVLGDPLPTRPFSLAALSPLMEFPHASPAAFNPLLGGSTTAVTWYAERCVRTIDVLRLYEDTPAADVVRTLAPYAYYGPGFDVVTWDGRDRDGLIVPPGRYAIHVRAFSTRVRAFPTDGVCWVTVR